MPKKIMILEDNEEMLKFLSELIKKMLPDAQLYMFRSMTGVYETVMNTYIDLFIVDVILDKSVPGDTSGIRFVEKVRGVLKYEFTPIIFITSLQDPKFYAFNQLHCYSFIEKPIKPGYVEETIRKALRFRSNGYNDPVLFFRKDGLIITIRCSEIIYIESINHRQHFHLVKNKMEVIPYKTCGQILAEIGNGDFFQCNRSTIINRRYVECVDLVNKYIKLKDVEEPVGIGATYRARIESEFRHGG